MYIHAHVYTYMSCIMYNQSIHIYLHTYMHVKHTHRKYIYICVHFLDTWPREARRFLERQNANVQIDTSQIWRPAKNPAYLER